MLSLYIHYVQRLGWLIECYLKKKTVKLETGLTVARV